MWFLLSIGIRHPRHVIKAQASELQLLRTKAARGRIFLETPTLKGLSEDMSSASQLYPKTPYRVKSHHPTVSEVRQAFDKDDLPRRMLQDAFS